MPASPWQARDGFDTRGVNFLGSAWASNGVAINSAGAVSPKTMETDNGVQALTAIVSGASVINGGLYNSVPGFTMGPPQLGGMTAQTATVTASAMGLVGLTGLKSTGVGYAVGDVLTAGTGLVIPLSGGTATADVGLTGTPFPSMRPIRSAALRSTISRTTARLPMFRRIT